MLLNKSGGSGRDVIFRLVAVADPASKQVMQQWGNDLAKAQTRAAKAASKVSADEMKKTADDQKKTATAATLDISKMHQRAEREDAKFRLNLYKATIKEEMKAEDELVKWRQRVRANSLIQEQRDNLKAIQDRKKAEIQAAREVTRERRKAELETIRRGRGLSHLAGSVGELGRGLAYSGLVGQENTQTILNTMLAVEGGGSLIRGGTGIYKSLRHVMGAGALGGIGAGGAGAGAGAGGFAALAATAGSAAAAIAGMAAAAVSAAATLEAARKHGFGRGADAGGLVDRIATMEVKAGAGLYGIIPKSWRGNSIGPTAALDYMFGGLTASADAISRQQAAHSQRMEAGRVGGERFSGFLNQRNATVGAMIERAHFTAMQTGSIDDRVAAGRAALDISRKDVGQLRDWRDKITAGTSASASERTAVSEAATAAEARHREMLKSQLELIREQHREKIAMAREGVQGAQQELAIRQQEASQLKQIADAARRNVMGDAERFLTASPEERAGVIGIAQKRARGEDLNPAELSLAGTYNEFSKYRESQVEKQARRMGLYDTLFTEGAGERRAAEKASAAGDTAVKKAELDLKQKIEVSVKVEGDKPPEAKAIAKELEPLLNDAIKEGRGYVDRAVFELRQEVKAIILNRRTP